MSIVVKDGYRFAEKLASAERADHPGTISEGSGLALALAFLDKVPVITRVFFNEKTANKVSKVVAAIALARIAYLNISRFIDARRERAAILKRQSAYPFRYTLSFISGTTAYRLLEAWVASLPLTDESFEPGEFDIEMAPSGTPIPERLMNRMMEYPETFEDELESSHKFLMVHKTRKNRTFEFEGHPCLVWADRDAANDPTLDPFGEKRVTRPQRTNVTLFCPVEDPAVMNRFLETLSLNWIERMIERDQSNNPFARGVTVFTADSYRSWEPSTLTNANRHIVLPGNLLDQIIADVEKFEGKREWYEAIGIPHRRTYLFEGLPGTGKTTLGIVMANRLKKDIYILSLKGQSDHSLLQKLRSVPAGQIVLLEDIDCAFNNDRMLDAGEGKTTSKTTGDDDRLTTSGLLNALDGAASKEGQIVIMTTNHAELLTPALVRPGRVDVRVHFDHATDEQIRGLAERFLGIDQGRQFIEQLPKDRRYTMAEIQERLISEVFRDVEDISTTLS